MYFYIFLECTSIGVFLILFLSSFSYHNFIDKKGIPTYGRTYTLQDANKNEIGVSVESLGEPGPFTLSPGSLGFNEVRQYHLL
jgi:hypothetical protein